MVCIEDGYVIEAEVSPGGMRKSHLYLERSKSKALKAILQEAEQYDAFIYGQKFTVKVFQKATQIFSSDIMQYITYNLPNKHHVNFLSSDIEDEFAPADMYMDNQIVEWTTENDNDDLPIENKIIELYKRKDNLEYSVDYIQDVMCNKIKLDKTWAESIPNIGIVPNKYTSKYKFPKVINTDNEDESDNDYSYEEGFNDLG